MSSKNKVFADQIKTIDHQSNGIAEFRESILSLPECQSVNSSSTTISKPRRYCAV